MSTSTAPKNYIKAPTVPYPGAKGRLAPMLVEFMPQSGDRYVEPFAGRGNVFWAAALNRSFRRWYINDIATAKFFQALRDIKDCCSVPVRTRSEYERQKRRFRFGDAWAVLLEPYLTFSGGGYAKGGFGGARSATADGYSRTIARCRNILLTNSVVITDKDWSKIGLERLGQDDFVFLDPPYYGADVRAYSGRGFDYEQLVSVLRGARFRWLLTEYRQPFYLRQLGQPFFEREVQLACDRQGTRSRVECCWKNY